MRKSIVKKFKSEDFGNVNVWYNTPENGEGCPQVNAKDLVLFNVSPEDLESDQFWSDFFHAWDAYVQCYSSFGAVCLDYTNIEEGIQNLKDAHRDCE